jgi:flavin-dependent dehydrogenase
MHDVAIAGGGPAGLAAAIRAAQRGFRTVLFERSHAVPDKACGEGLMPSGARELERLGIRIAQDRCAPFRGIRYLQEDGTVLEARFGTESGIGIRRTALGEALRDRALASGVDLRHGTVTGATALPGCVELRTDAGAAEARLLIAADGLHSPLRRAAGLDLPQPGRAPVRYGIRRHFALPPWTDFVEVHWAEGVEAYVTPVGPRSVNVAFLREGETKDRFEELLGRFPSLRERIGDAGAASEVRGAGPLLQRVRARAGERLALIGDAAGYVDAITGQGLSLAFAASAVLMEALPDDLSTDLRPALQRYEAGVRARWLRYALPAHALVALSRRPGLRRSALRSIARFPLAFGVVVRIVE